MYGEQPMYGQQPYSTFPEQPMNPTLLQQQHQSGGMSTGAKMGMAAAGGVALGAGAMYLGTHMDDVGDALGGAVEDMGGFVGGAVEDVGGFVGDAVDDIF